MEYTNRVLGYFHSYVYVYVLHMVKFINVHKSLILTMYRPTHFNRMVFWRANWPYLSKNKCVIITNIDTCIKKFLTFHTRLVPIPKGKTGLYVEPRNMYMSTSCIHMASLKYTRSYTNGSWLCFYVLPNFIYSILEIPPN